uniref:Uncharacterized protein n=1 Tax=Citrobacter phage NS1 TaxID=2766968 RepID=A0A7G9IRG2_9CAUD
MGESCINTQLVTHSYYQSNLLFYKEFGLNYHYRKDPGYL